MGFTRDDTKKLKGLAALMIMFHHLVGFPDRYPASFPGFQSILGQDILVDIGLNCKVAISIFFFLGGYGLYKQWEAGKYNFAHSIASLYRRYWKVFLIFVPIGFLFFSYHSSTNPILVTFYPIQGAEMKHLVSDVVANFLGISCTLNPSWWFLMSYVCTIPIGLIFCRIAKKHGLPLCFYLAVAMDILIRNVFPNQAWAQSNYYFTNIIQLSEYSTCFYVGVGCASSNLLSQIRAEIHKLAHDSIVWRFCINVAGIGLLFFTRCWIIGKTADLLLVPFLCVFAADLIDCLPPIGFRFLGKHSMNLWLIHCFYVSYYEPISKIVYSTQSALADFGILFVLTLLSSICVEVFYWVLGKVMGGIDLGLQYLDGRKRTFFIPNEKLPWHRKEPERPSEEAPAEEEASVEEADKDLVAAGQASKE